MIRRIYTAGAALALTVSAVLADTLTVDRFDYYGPYPVTSPVVFDSLNIKGQRYNPEEILTRHLNLSVATPAKLDNVVTVPGDTTMEAMHVLAFDLQNTHYATPRLNVKGLKNFKVTVDGKPASAGKLTLNPATHRVMIKYLSKPDSNDTLAVTVETDDSLGYVALRNDGKRMLTIDDIVNGTRLASSAVSPDGRYFINRYWRVRPGGKYHYYTRVVSAADGRVLTEVADELRWLPTSTRYWFTRPGMEGGRELVTVDPATGVQDIMVSNMPDGYFTIAPDEKSIIFTVSDAGHKEGDVYRIVEPDDRQPGWRNRSRLNRYDLATGVLTPLTHGKQSISLDDISTDGSKLLIHSYERTLGERPTPRSTYMLLDVNTMTVDTLCANAGFLSAARLSPDGKKVLFTGSPEAFGGVGRNLPADRTPSVYDYQLFLMDAADKSVRPVTRDFDPSISSCTWSRYDGMIYIVANNRDRVTLHRLNPATGVITTIPTDEDVVGGISLAVTAPVATWHGQSALNGTRLYSLNTRNMRSTLLDDVRADELKDVDLGTCEEWNFVNSRGDSITGRYYLPADFDPSKKYPMLVYYYGGCSPVERNFESRYPHPAYAALGYVVYVLQPSGAAGFGQEFASRHVNSAGEGVADDIIEGTRRFCEEHPYVDSTKIGCFGASYGGFMTQYLQTVTDLFAAAISHAGISDHTSYWGNGYWGYSYSEVSMANSYPWSHADLYVKHSPLYNAHKIHTPLLFVHGDKDTNVPFGESVQMFTALKLLGRPTAFVGVTDENHHINDYDKRLKWQNTMYAWFAKYLQDDPTWWDALYPEI